MKASALFGAGWEDDSVEVLWQDAGRAFCRLWRDGAAGERHAFIPVLSGAEHPTLESINRLTHEYELKDYLAARGRCGQWSSCASAGGRCWLSSTPEASPSIALSASRWRSDDFYGSPWRCLPHLAGSTDVDSFTKTSTQPT